MGGCLGYLQPNSCLFSSLGKFSLLLRRKCVHSTPTTPDSAGLNFLIPNGKTLIGVAVLKFLVKELRKDFGGNSAWRFALWAKPDYQYPGKQLGHLADTPRKVMPHKWSSWIKQKTKWNRSAIKLDLDRIQVWSIRNLTLPEQKFLILKGR